MQCSLIGNLDLEKIRIIFSKLIEDNPRSTWLISDGEDEKVIFFNSGSIAIYASSGRAICSVEDYLLKKGDITSEQLDQAKKIQARKEGSLLVKVLHESEFLNQTIYQERVEELLLGALNDTVVWEGAHTEFYEGNPPSFFHDQEAVFTGTVDVSQLVTKALMFLENWSEQKEQLLSEKASPRVNPSCPDLNDDDPNSKLLGHFLAHINGKNTIREIQFLGGLGLEKTYSVLCDGVDKEIFKIEPPTKLEFSNPSAVWKEIERLESNVPSLYLPALAQHHLLTLFEHLDSPPLVSRQMQVIGISRLQQGKPDRAIDWLRKAVKTYPENLSAHESLIEVFFTLGQEEVAFNEVNALVKRLINFRMYEAAERQLNGILKRFPKRQDLRLTLVELNIFLDQNDEAIRDLLYLAYQKVEHTSWDEAFEYFNRVKELDPLNDDAKKGLKKVQNALRKGKKLILSRSCAACAVILLGLWFVSDGLTKRSWAEAQSEIRDQVESGDLKGGLERVGQIAQKYPNLRGPELLRVQEKLFSEKFFNLDKSMREAVELSDQGRCIEAIEILINVKSNTLVEEQKDKASKLLNDIKNFRKAWLKVRSSSRKHLEANFRKEAFSLAHRLIQGYPEGAMGLQVPLLIQTRNPGARVRLDGEDWGYSPTWIILEYGANQEIEIIPDSGRAKKFKNLLKTKSFNVILDI